MGKVCMLIATARYWRRNS